MIFLDRRIHITTLALLFIQNSVVFAQTVPPPTLEKVGFDWSSIAIALINQSFAFILAIGSYYINKKIKDQQMRDLLSKSLTSAVGVVKGAAADALKSSRSLVTTTGNRNIDAGVQYVLNNASEAISHFNITDEKIAEKILARVGLVDAGIAPPS